MSIYFSGLPINAPKAFSFLLYATDRRWRGLYPRSRLSVGVSSSLRYFSENPQKNKTKPSSFLSEIYLLCYQKYSIICISGKKQSITSADHRRQNERDTANWNGHTFIRKTVHLQKPNLLLVKFTALCETIQYRRRISEHCLKKIPVGLRINQPLRFVRAVGSLSIQIYRTSSDSKIDISGNSENIK